MSDCAASGEPPSFLFATCQVGAERALKAELQRVAPHLHLSYSRPGYLTFKNTLPESLAASAELDCVFARAWGVSLGKATGTSQVDVAREAWRLAGNGSHDCLHVWQRDAALPGHRGFEPGISQLARDAADALHQAAPIEPSLTRAATAINQPAALGQTVLDCVIVEPHEWWIGEHRATTAARCQPGGLWPIAMPAEAVSRAYLKMEEALLWSEFPVQAGDHWAEIGCAPGGSSQALLARGMTVLGIDPADVEPSVLASPGFTHVKKRGADLKRREFRAIRWLAADINVAPAYTLDTVEAIVTYETVDIQGLLLTLKLLDWKLAEEIPDYLERIRGWGYAQVRARQLAHNRREFCVAALKTATPRKHTTATRQRRSRTPQRHRPRP